VTSTPIEVADWLDAKTFSPAMTATLSLPAADALALLSGALAGQGFTIKDATAGGFTASWSDWTGWLGVLAATDMDFKRTRLSVTAAPAPSGTTLTIAVEKGGQHRGGRRRGRAALTAAFQDVQRQGGTVTTTPWVKPPRR
jgi:hypothetical protein